MSFFRRSRVSMCAPGHSCRGLLLVLEWFYFRGNKKVMRFWKTYVHKEVWPGLTVTPVGISVKHGHTRGYKGQTWSHLEGKTVKNGHPWGEIELTGNFSGPGVGKYSISARDRPPWVKKSLCTRKNGQKVTMYPPKWSPQGQIL